MVGELMAMSTGRGAVDKEKVLAFRAITLINDNIFISERLQQLILTTMK